MVTPHSDSHVKGDVTKECHTPSQLVGHLGGSSHSPGTLYWIARVSFLLSGSLPTSYASPRSLRCPPFLLPEQEGVFRNHSNNHRKDYCPLKEGCGLPEEEVEYMNEEKEAISSL